VTAPRKLALIGDVMLATTKAEHFASESPGFAAASDRLRANDAIVANLEMPLSTRGYRVPKTSNLRSHPEVIRGVTAMGIHAVSLANNHMMDYGPVALTDTVETVAGAGLAYAGAGPDLDSALRPAILRAGDTTIGVLSFACTLPVESDAGPGKPGIAPIRVGFSFEIDATLLVEQPGSVPIVRSWADPTDQAAAEECIRTLKKDVDLVVVMIHWGVPGYWLSPYQGLLATYQQPLGRALIDAGADVICGHHSHSLHPVEMYRGKPIFYSLGNYLFEGARAFMEPESIIAEYDLDDGTWTLVPLLLDPDGFPELVDGDQASTVLSKLKSMSKPFGDPVRIAGALGTLAGG
jgi:poly-gamma-glutamate synthesis protein (capsule biosynthesis protein)